jgi:hypothetical protein
MVTILLPAYVVTRHRGLTLSFCKLFGPFPPGFLFFPAGAVSDLSTYLGRNFLSISDKIPRATFLLKVSVFSEVTAAQG